MAPENNPLQKEISIGKTIIFLGAMLVSGSVFLWILYLTSGSWKDRRYRDLWFFKVGSWKQVQDETHQIWQQFLVGLFFMIIGPILLMEDILHQLRLKVYPTIYKVLYIPGG